MVTAAILGNLLTSEGKTILMSKKKKAKKKRNRPRKGVMPPALKAYWAKKRAKKNSRRRKKKNTRRPRKSAYRRRRPNKRRPLKQAKAILLSELRRAGYAIAPKPNRRRRKKANPRKKVPRSIRIPGTVTPKQRKAIGRFLARATGKRIVYKKAGRK
jgi:hypothetical protein